MTKNIKKKIMRPSGSEPTIHRLKDHRAIHYATEFGAMNRQKYLLYAEVEIGKKSAVSVNVTVY